MGEDRNFPAPVPTAEMKGDVITSWWMNGGMFVGGVGSASASASHTSNFIRHWLHPRGDKGREEERAFLFAVCPVGQIDRKYRSTLINVCSACSKCVFLLSYVCYTFWQEILKKGFRPVMVSQRICLELFIQRLVMYVYSVRLEAQEEKVSTFTSENLTRG